MRSVLVLALTSVAAIAGEQSCSKTAGHGDGAPPITPPTSATTAVATNSSPSSPSSPSQPPIVASASSSAAPTPIVAPPPPPMLADEWDGAIGKWTFEPTGELTSEGKTASSSIYRKGFNAKDFDLKVEFKFDSIESSAGVLFRYVGTDFYVDSTFYQLEWYTRGSHHDKRLSLMKKSKINDSPDTYWIQMVDPKYPDPTLDVWHSFRIRAVGDRIESWLDGEALYDKKDLSFVRRGKVGLHSFMPRRMQYRGFNVTSLDPPAK